MKLIQLLRRLSKDSSAEIYYAGEYARDVLRRRKSGRVEVVAKNVLFKDLVRHIKRVIPKATKAYVSKSRDYVQFVIENKSVTVHLPKKGNKYNPNNSLRDDAKTRFFTINAMYIPVKPKKGIEVIDFYRGRDCIKNRRVKVIGRADTAIKRNPAIMISAVSLAARLNYRLDNNLFYATKANYALIDEVPVEQVRDEFIHIIMSNKPSRYLRTMHKSGLLYKIIPELSMCDGVAQNVKYHKYDVMTHCLVACDSAEKDIIVRLAALFHDIGKVQTRDEIYKAGNNRVTFYNHEVTGSKLVRKILRRLKFDKETVTTVSELVYNHMYNYEPNRWSEAAVRRFIGKVNIVEGDLDDLDNMRLFLLRKADRKGSGVDLSDVSPRQIAFQKHIKQVYERSKALDVKDLDIDGAVIMERFRLKPGPTVGNILNHLLSLVVDDQSLNKRNALVEAASKYLSEALK